MSNVDVLDRLARKLAKETTLHDAHRERLVRHYYRILDAELRGVLGLAGDGRAYHDDGVFRSGGSNHCSCVECNAYRALFERAKGGEHGSETGD